MPRFSTLLLLLLGAVLGACDSRDAAPAAAETKAYEDTRERADYLDHEKRRKGSAYYAMHETSDAGADERR